jgi:hypothetical protein
MFLFKHIYKNASLGLRSSKREGMNGTKLVLKLAFAKENKIF